MALVIIQDACVLLNLLASERFADIAGGCGLKFVVAARAASETLYLRHAITGEHELVDLPPLIKNGLLEVVNLAGEGEQLRFIELATDLDDGEAESIAIAESRSFALATDDKKARKVLQRKAINVELWSTGRILQHWQAKAFISDADLSNALKSISERAKFRPKRGHPDFAWWSQIWSGLRG
jgi:predicted nucleic acid-binding protein